MTLTHLGQMRAAAIEEVLGYTVVPDARAWIYGDLTNFWLPPNYTCILPPDTLDPKKTHLFASEGWHKSRRLILDRTDPPMYLLDDTVRKASIDKNKTRELQMLEKLYRLTIERCVTRSFTY